MRRGGPCWPGTSSRDTRGPECSDLGSSASATGARTSSGISMVTRIAASSPSPTGSGRARAGRDPIPRRRPARGRGGGPDGGRRRRGGHCHACLEPLRPRPAGARTRQARVRGEALHRDRCRGGRPDRTGGATQSRHHVDHTFLFTGAVRKIKELVDSGILGRLYYYDSTRVNLGLSSTTSTSSGT
jgi:hypothetical protein